jgi:hypothetical protein
VASIVPSVGIRPTHFGTQHPAVSGILLASSSRKINKLHIDFSFINYKINEMTIY